VRAPPGQVEAIFTARAVVLCFRERTGLREGPGIAPVALSAVVLVLTLA
jgi:hypothetical protein